MRGFRLLLLITFSILPLLVSSQEGWGSWATKMKEEIYDSASELSGDAFQSAMDISSDVFESAAELSDVFTSTAELSSEVFKVKMIFLRMEKSQ